ncbi:hypothetical protein ACFL0G_02075 [Candidatus Zixiibacteriota bacterium]
MVNPRRLFWATLMGITAGVLCVILSGGPANSYPTWMVIGIIFNRGLVGFLIGISTLRWGWAAHGIFWGLLISLMIAIPAWGGGDGQAFFLFMIAGAVWGFLIELFTSKTFKAPAG